MSRIEITLDGNQWCAKFDDFDDLQNSPAGFGSTPQLAARDLLGATIKEIHRHCENNGAPMNLRYALSQVEWVHLKPSLLENLFHALIASEMGDLPGWLKADEKAADIEPIPDYVGAFPIRQDITVLPTLPPHSSPHLGVVYQHMPIRDCHDCPITRYDSLHIGTTVKITGLHRVYTSVITSIDGKTAQAEGLFANIEFDEKQGWVNLGWGDWSSITYVDLKDEGKNST